MAEWMYRSSRWQWPRGLRHETSSSAWTLGSWVRIPIEAWVFVCVYSVFVLSCVGSGLATGWSLVQGVLPIVYKCKNTEPHKEEAKARYGLQRHWSRRRRRCINPPFVDLGTSSRWVVSFTPRPLYPLGKSPRYPLDRRLGEPQSRSGRCGEEKNLNFTGTRTPTPRPSRA
jgi:hypothetical protein